MSEVGAVIDVLQVLSLSLVTLALVPALAHALELPGTLRLTKGASFAVQPIYYPGSTVAGISEPIAILSTIGLLVLTPRGSAGFWLTLEAVLGLLAMHAVYWLFAHPVNNFWLQGQTLSGLGTRFFSAGSERRTGRESETPPGSWTSLRDRGSIRTSRGRHWRS
jgi:hypothetical protein